MLLFYIASVVLPGFLLFLALVFLLVMPALLLGLRQASLPRAVVSTLLAFTILALMCSLVYAVLKTWLSLV